MSTIRPNRFAFIICLSIIALMASCSKSSPAEVLAHADQAIASGDTLDVLQCCQSLDSQELSPSQLCHQALLYAKLAQIGNNPEHMASATGCLKNALTQSTDSVMVYLSTLQFVDLATLNEVYSLATNSIDDLLNSGEAFLDELTESTEDAESED